MQKRIIVFEDDISDFTFLKNAFSKIDKTMELVRVSHLDDLAVDISRNGISCLLLDLKMPQVDGFELLKKIKSNDQLKLIPVIVFSSSSNPKDIEYSYELGANAYIVKPSTLHGYKTFATKFYQFWMDLVILPDGFN
ncbi:response regulator [Lentilitoribacter sp. Alg239-R112]|uniref:response regulator n=1 Tax=Lentilitoribacter sp. Alg239-R112 TaxID=2305987 RepID=UPI0013A6A502|nr:response regulator [Lentilitoribacter sp. Alg239-R112]